MSTSDKYDRQLRLWGAHGQRSLMNSRVMLVNGDACGSETLKNLVLPGVGQFTIIDDKFIDSIDLENNFFVDNLSIGQSRAETVKNLLCEMNPDVIGHAIHKNVDDLLKEELSFFENYSLIIVSNITIKTLLLISELCDNLSIPLIYIQSIGLIGKIRLQVKKHQVIESKPDNIKHDLRLTNPFPSLLNYCISSKSRLDIMDSREHSHTPYIIILIIALEQFKSKYNGKLPSNSVEKEEFISLIKSLRKSENESNFDEALTNAYLCYSNNDLPSEVIDLLAYQRHNPLDSDFDILLRGLDLYLSTNDIPLNGGLPDLTSTTESFLELQSIYHKKAKDDRDTLKNIINQLLQELNRPINSISDELIDLFCKNIPNLRQISTNTILHEWNNINIQTIKEILEDDPYVDFLQTPIIWYLALHANHLFQLEYNRNTNQRDDNKILFYYIQNLFNKIDVSIDENDLMKIVNEIIRYNNEEFHTISALVGGIAAQEAVKILTHQYLPINNTYIYNGIAGFGSTYEL